MGAEWEWERLCRDSMSPHQHQPPVPWLMGRLRNGDDDGDTYQARKVGDFWFS